MAELKTRGWRFSDDQIQFRNTVELDLNLPEDELLANMKSKTRYNIRLAGRKDVIVRRGTADDFPLIAEYEGTPLGAVIIVKYGRRAIYMYGASNNKERNRMPNYLLQWEAIRWAKEQGCEIYDFWGAPDEFVESDSLWGVWRFKSGFEGEVVRHVGAWDYPARPFWYWAYTQIIPRYLAFLRVREE